MEQNNLWQHIQKEETLACWKNNKRLTLAKYQLEHRNKIGKINYTRICVENSFTEEKLWVNQGQIHYVINLYNYIDFHAHPTRKLRSMQEKIQT